MSGHASQTKARRRERQHHEQQEREAARRSRLHRRAGYVGVGVIATVLITLAVVLGGSGGATHAGQRAEETTAAGSTVGSVAPAFALTDVTSGKQITLASLAGHKTLLFFSEGVSCQACLVQAADLQRSSKLASAGIELVSITTDRPGELAQAAREYGIRTPMLADPSTRMSAAYGMLARGGMEHEGQDGHAFMLLNEHGRIVWQRAYPEMYVPPGQLLHDMGAAR